MCTVLPPPGVNPNAVNKYIISYRIISYHIISHRIASHRIVSYHIIYHIISYILSYIIIYHIVSYHIICHIYHHIMYHIFSKSTQITNFIKIRQVGAELFHADGQTDMTKLIIAFRNFDNSPQNVANCARELSVGFHGIPSAVLQLCVTHTDR